MLRFFFASIRLTCSWTTPEAAATVLSLDGSGFGLEERLNGGCIASGSGEVLGSGSCRDDDATALRVEFESGSSPESTISSSSEDESSRTSVVVSRALAPFPPFNPPRAAPFAPPLGAFLAFADLGVPPLGPAVALPFPVPLTDIPCFSTSLSFSFPFPLTLSSPTALAPAASLTCVCCSSSSMTGAATIARQS